MPKDFLGLISRPTSVLKALRRITLGGILAAAGLPVSAAAVPNVATPMAQSPTLSPTIVDRSRKVGKLVLQLPGGHASAMTPQHRSHRSHSSHSSHRSSSSGTTAPPVVARPTPTPTPTPAAAAVGLLEANAVVGEIETIDRLKRVIVIKQGATSKRSFAFRDDSKFESPTGISYRFDEFAEANGGRLPVIAGERVQVLWRTSTDGKTQIVTSIKKTR